MVTDAKAKSQESVVRADALIKEASRYDLDAIVASSVESVAYYGGLYIHTQVLAPDRQAFFIAQPATRRVILLVCDIEAPLIRDQSPIQEVREYAEINDPVEVLSDLLIELGKPRKLGVETRRLSTRSAQ